MNVVHIRQSCPPPTSFIAPRTCHIRTKSWPSALCSNTRRMALYGVSYFPTFTLLDYQSLKSCANSAFVKLNGWRINKDYSILFYSIIVSHGGENRFVAAKRIEIDWYCFMSSQIFVRVRRSSVGSGPAGCKAGSRSILFSPPPSWRPLLLSGTMKIQEDGPR